MNRLFRLILLTLLIMSCSHRPPLATVEYVDIDKFMGDWYVIANIPTFLEKTAHNAVESYQRNDDGSIATKFTFLDGAFDGNKKVYKPKGFIADNRTNALWRMQFVWPFKADYRIIHLADDYSTTIIGRQARDYVWIMARNHQLSDVDYSSLVSRVEAAGYNTNRLRRVPQQWPAE